MSKGTTSTVALVVDDEPEYLVWLKDYLESVGLSTDVALNLSEALEAIEKKDYRLIILDMEIPASGASAALLKKGPLAAQKYPGIIAAIHCRSKGYGAHQIIAYTVHDQDALDVELAKLNCRYVLKGRPHVLKSVIRSSLPHQAPRKARSR